MTLALVRERIAAAAGRVGRDPSEVTLVGVCKGIDVHAVRPVVEGGLADLGVNRAQEMADKAAALPPVRWHYLGAVQTNKVKLLAGVHLIHGLCRQREALALRALAQREGRVLDVLIEVNLAGEASKQGIPPGDLEGLLDALDGVAEVRTRGLMFVAPQVENPEDVRWVFTEGRRLRERFADRGLTELSMGMTNDYEIAIEEGATIVRVGRAIFTERKGI